MRITFVLPLADLSGGIRVVAIYAERLRRRGHDVRVVSSAPGELPLHRKARSLLAGRGWPRGRRGPSHLDGLDVPHRRLERWRPVTDADVPDADAVIATWWETAEWVARLSPAKGAKIHFIQHYEVFQAAVRPRVEATWRLPLHKIAVAQWLVDLARDRYGDETAVLVPNGVDLRQFHAPRRGKQPVPTVGLMYSTVRFKGCDISLEAVRRARTEIPNLRLIAFGAEEPDPLVPLPADAEFVRSPPQEQLRELYARCDAWLFGSRSEGFGLPILEALACRTPVLGTPTGAAPELLADGAGVLVPGEDPAALAAAIVDVCRLPDDEWQQLSSTAYARARQHSWDDSVIAFEAAVERAIARNRRNHKTAAGELAAQRPR